MLEAREACDGATGRNGGHTKAASYRTYLQHKEELGTDEALRIARLEYANILWVHRIAKELDIDCESHLCNTVDLIYDGETFESGKSAITALQADSLDEEKEEGGMAHYRVYSAEEAASRFYVVSQNQNPEVQCEERLVGAFEYLAGRLNAYRFTTGMLKECVKRGLQLCTNTPAHKIIPLYNHREEDGTAYKVSTPHNTIHTRSVILATNGYTPCLLPLLQGAIVPLRGQITAQVPGTNCKLPNPLPTTYSFIYRSGYEYMVPRPPPEGEQHIIIGGGLGRQPEAGASEYGTVDDTSINASISRYLNGSLVGYFGSENWGKTPEDGSTRILHEWTGIMGTTADGRPFVGEVPGLKGVWISAGFNGHGMVLAAKCASALVQMVKSPTGIIDWFPQSFILAEQRIRESVFKGVTDMSHYCKTAEPGVEQM
jgi:glycine/D-amino acid oxidase-like deaminating enzyme